MIILFYGFVKTLREYIFADKTLLVNPDLIKPVTTQEVPTQQAATQQVSTQEDKAVITPWMSS
jgi:hypothetical protein